MLRCICRLMARSGARWTGRACLLCPGRSDINLFRYRECVVYFDPEIAHCALDLRVTEQELDGPQVACASVDQGRLGSPEGMRGKPFWIKPNARHPIGKKSGVLTGAHGPALSTASGEQVLTGPCWLLSGSRRQLDGFDPSTRLHWSPRLPLPHGCAIDCIAIRSNIIDLQGDNIATTELAVDGKIEQGEVAGSPFDQQPGPDRPNLVWP
jgi:hypothetical protein